MNSEQRQARKFLRVGEKRSSHLEGRSVEAAVPLVTTTPRAQVSGQPLPTHYRRPVVSCKSIIFDNALLSMISPKSRPQIAPSRSCLVGQSTCDGYHTQRMLVAHHIAQRIHHQLYKDQGSTFKHNSYSQSIYQELKNPRKNKMARSNPSLRV